MRPKLPPCWFNLAEYLFFNCPNIRHGSYTHLGRFYGQLNPA